MAAEKTSEFTLDATPGAGSYVPYVDPTEAADADKNKRILFSDVGSAAGLVIGTDVQAFDAVLDATTASFTTADESKLDGIAAGAEVNTVDSVNAATGAVVLDPDDLDDTATTNKFTTAGDISKLAGIEAAADVTDTANVTAAGALMDSEVDADIKTLSLPASTTISAFGATLVDDADAVTARTTLGAVADYVAPVNVTGTTDTMSAADHGVTVWYSNASAVTVTLPTDAADDLADGFWCMLVSTGAAGLTLSTAGLTLLGSPNTTISTGEGLFVQKTAAANSWLVLGGTAA